MFKFTKRSRKLWSIVIGLLFLASLWAPLAEPLLAASAAILKYDYPNYLVAIFMHLACIPIAILVMATITAPTLIAYLRRGKNELFSGSSWPSIIAYFMLVIILPTLNSILTGLIISDLLGQFSNVSFYQVATETNTILKLQLACFSIAIGAIMLLPIKKPYCSPEHG